MPQQLNQIRSVRLTYHCPEATDEGHFDQGAFASTCAALTKMSNLDELVIRLHPTVLLTFDSPVFRGIVNLLHQSVQSSILVVHLFTFVHDRDEASYNEELPFQIVLHNSQDNLFNGHAECRLRNHSILNVKRN